MQWDEVGEEASEHAAVWHIYNDEAAKTDAATTDGFNRGIDVLLVFVRILIIPAARKKTYWFIWTVDGIVLRGLDHVHHPIVPADATRRR